MRTGVLRIFNWGFRLGPLGFIIQISGESGPRLLGVARGDGEIME
jgi:hypothetical protein